MSKTPPKKKHKITVNTYVNGTLANVQVVYRSLRLRKHVLPMMNWKHGQVHLKQDLAGNYYYDEHIHTVDDKREQLLAMLREDA